jgi:alpha-tubulin suppressor-like RCC1 family protein
MVGDGTVENRFSATPILPGTTWTAVSAGEAQTCGIQTDRSMWCWGFDNVATTRTAPARIGSATTWAGVSVGSQHVCGVRTDNSLWCWGQNGFGRLGLGDGGPQWTSSPAKVAGTGWAAASAGSLHSCATKTDGTAWCWGHDGDGRLGLGVSAPHNVTLPARVGTGTTWTSIDAAGFHTCATSTGGTLSCWGTQRYGALGVGRVDGTGLPQVVPGSWTKVTTGISHTCAVQAVTAQVACWGHGALGYAVVTGGDPVV